MDLALMILKLVFELATEIYSRVQSGDTKVLEDIKTVCPTAGVIAASDAALKAAERAKAAALGS